MKRIATYMILAAVLMASACVKQEASLSQQREIRFSASMGLYQTKATDTAFEEGDLVGVSIGDPVSVGNHCLSVQNGAFVASSSVYWDEEQQPGQESVFWAYYPYAADRDLAEGFDFTVQADQSTHAGYTASDLMTAFTTASPSDDVVTLPFRHRLTKLVLKLDNQTGNSISEVYVGNILGRVFVCQGEEVQSKGIPGMVKACQVTLADGSPAWALVLAPQTVAPTLMVTTTNQKQYTYALAEALDFLPGHRYLTTLTLDGNATATPVSTQVTEWTDNSDIQFGHYSSFEEVIAGEDGATFLVEGIITEIANYNYGNLYLSDGKGGSLYIYGMVTEDGTYPRYLPKGWYDPAFNLIPGDEIAVQGVKATYGDVTELEQVTIKTVCRHDPSRNSIKNIRESGIGESWRVEGVVYALSSRGVVVYDGESYILAYTEKSPECAVGDYVQIDGPVVLYRNFPEISHPRYSVLSSGSQMHQVFYTDINDSIDNPVDPVTVPVSVEGMLSILYPYYMVQVDGKDTRGNIYWPCDEGRLNAMEGHKIRVKGFLLSAYTLVVNEENRIPLKDIIATELEDLGESGNLENIQDGGEHDW